MSGRRSRVDLSTQRYFEIADDPDRTYEERIDGYLALADEDLDAAAYQEWCDQELPHLPEAVHDWVSSPAFDRLLVDTVRSTYPEHEQEQFLAHFRGLVGMWVSDQAAVLGSAGS